MDNIDSLIKRLREFQEELNKNMNCAPGSNPNMSKEEEMDKAATKAPTSSPVVGVPAAQMKQAKIKNLQRQIESGTYKPDAGKIADKMLKEELTCSENGQWNIIEKSANPYKVEHHSSYNHDNGTIHQYSIHHNGQHVASGYIHEPEAGHKAEPTVISPESSQHAHHNNAKAMSALEEHNKY